MQIDFSKPMTFYELIAILLAALAILIPIIQAIWNKWIKKPQLNYYQNGKAVLFFNQSGSYIRVDGVYEALKKSITVNKIDLSIKRHKDGQNLNLSWSTITSPINQNFVGNFMQTTEIAHAFRIETDSIACAFIEFTDSFNSAGKSFKESTNDLFKKVNWLKSMYNLYEEALNKYKGDEEYAKARNKIEKDFFWEIGKYEVIIAVKYGNKTKRFRFEFTVNEQDYKKLIGNIEESLITPLKSAYGINWYYQNVEVELSK